MGPRTKMEYSHFLEKRGTLCCQFVILEEVNKCLLVELESVTKWLLSP